MNNMKRLFIIASIEIVIVVILLIYYGSIMLVPSSNPTIEQAQEQKERGVILDRRGTVLGIQVQRESLTVWKPEIRDIPETVDFLSDILGLDAQYIEGILRNSNGFSIIQRSIKEEQSQRIRTLQEGGALKGIHLIPDTKRKYPLNAILSQTIGYVGIDGQGLEGIEYVLDDALSGRSSTHNAGFGHQVVLTIDATIQQVLANITRETYQKHRATQVSVLAMEAKTGEILASFSTPSFDPEEFTSYRAQTRRNRIIADTYEPGSVFKIFSISSLLDSGSIHTRQVFDASSAYIAPDNSFQIRDISSHGLITTGEIIKYSSNVGAAYAAENGTDEEFYAKLQDFGFGQKTNILLNGEGSGSLAPPRKWSSRTRQTIAIGQEIGVTMLQMVSAATVFTNKGVLLQPLIVKKILSPTGKVVESFERTPIRKVISETTAQTMLHFMQTATEDGGTASRLRNENISISAKTGTAEVYDPSINRYSDTAYIASTLAIFPAEDPQIILYLTIYEPRAGQIYGGQIAAPVIKEMVSFLLPYLDIPYEEAEYFTSTIPDVNLPPLTLESTIPDLTGYPKRLLLPLFQEERVRLRITGTGWVVRQSPSPGTKITDNMLLTLELE